jgi:hypothetical protein
MKKTMILFALLAGTSALGAHATTNVHNLSGRPGKAQKTKPYSCTISLTGTLSAGFGSISATCSATEGTCDLAQASATACLSSVMRSIKNQLK